MNEALLEVNLLIAAVVENHVDHERALKFLSTLDRFYTTPTTQGRLSPVPHASVEG